MNYNDAIEKIISEYGIDILSNRFITRSILSDYIRNQYESVKLIDALYNIYEICNVVDVFRENGFTNGRVELKKIYNESSINCSIKEYKNSINPISKYLFPDEYEVANNIKENNDVTLVASKNKNGSKNEKLTIINNEITKDVKRNNGNIIKNIEIDIGNNQLLLRRTKNNKIEIYVGNKQIDIKNYTIMNNTLFIDFKNVKTPNIIYIYIPHKNYDSLCINNYCADELIFSSIDIELYNLDLRKTNYIFKKILINGQYIKLDFKGYCNELVVNIKSNYSAVSVIAKLNKFSLKLLKGTIKFNIEPRLQKDMNIYIRAYSSVIKGKFGNRKLKKPLRHSILSKHPIVIDNSYNLNGNKINVDIITMKGTVTLL